MIEIDQNEVSTGSKVPYYLELLKVPFTVVNRGPEQARPDYVAISKDGSSAVGVEHKEIGDYLGSKQTGHLDNQLVELSKNFAISYVVVVGSRKFVGANPALRNSYISSFVGCSLEKSDQGLKGQIITVDDGIITSEEEFALFLKYLNDKVENNIFVRQPRLERVEVSKDEVALNVLCNFPKIGIVRAKAILAKYHNLQAFFAQLELGLPLEVEGINDQTESAIVESYFHMYNKEP